MSKTAVTYICQSCGGTFSKWAGRCPTCQEWNSIIEQAVSQTPQGLKAANSRKGQRLSFGTLQGKEEPLKRLCSGIEEFDRVCGEGIVPGAAMLVGGEPGIGKSTLLLQLLASYASAGFRCVYITGEEALGQVRLRATRLGVAQAPVSLSAATNVRDIITTLSLEKPDIVVIDSIQTMFLDSLDSSPGTVSQVRGSAQELIHQAKQQGYALFLVGHVTKEGTLAGPKTLEHMVDVVFQFEGERAHQFRILRGLKNRFGPTDEIGVFEMVQSGLQGVSNPSELFLSQRSQNAPGTIVFAGLEGSRPVLVEIQALVAPSPLGTPRRTVVGWDMGRLATILAVLETYCSLHFSQKDVYLNVAGGLKISEPGADLAVAAALISSLKETPAPEGCISFGEIALSGEVRTVPHADKRLKEAAKLGFTKALCPVEKKRKASPSSLSLREIEHVHALVQCFANSSF